MPGRNARAVPVLAAPSDLGLDVPCQFLPAVRKLDARAG